MPPPWSFKRCGKLQAISPATRMLVSSAALAVAAAVAAGGVISVLSYLVAPELAEGRLKLLLSELEPPPVPVHVVYPEGRRAAAKVRALVELLVSRLRADPVLHV